MPTCLPQAQLRSTHPVCTRIRIPPLELRNLRATGAEIFGLCEASAHGPPSELVAALHANRKLSPLVIEASWRCSLEGLAPCHSKGFGGEVM